MGLTFYGPGACRAPGVVWAGSDLTLARDRPWVPGATTPESRYDFESDGRQKENQGSPGVRRDKVVTISMPTATGEDFVGHLKKAAAAEGRRRLF